MDQVAERVQAQAREEAREAVAQAKHRAQLINVAGPDEQDEKACLHNARAAQIRRAVREEVARAARQAAEERRELQKSSLKDAARRRGDKTPERRNTIEEPQPKNTQVATLQRPEAWERLRVAQHDQEIMRMTERRELQRRANGPSAALRRLTDGENTPQRSSPEAHSVISTTPPSPPLKSVDLLQLGRRLKLAFAVWANVTRYSDPSRRENAHAAQQRKVASAHRYFEIRGQWFAFKHWEHCVWLPNTKQRKRRTPRSPQLPSLYMKQLESMQEPNPQVEWGESPHENTRKPRRKIRGVPPPTLADQPRYHQRGTSDRSCCVDPCGPQVHKDGCIVM